MCGIGGIINFDERQTSQARQIHQMMNKIKHRGPDDEGFLLCTKNGCRLFHGDDTPCNATDGYASNCGREHIENAYTMTSHIAFGHRRLSIIDLSLSGHQPMSYLDRYWIVYNGEIYNYIELRQELVEEGYSFFSSTDTEVILAAYDKWGSACLNKFNGMWAFVIYDSQEDRIFISRDRFGIKPLYYYKDDEAFVFASEIKALLEYETIQTVPNISYCREYVAEGPKEYIKETAFENIFRFDNASFLEIGIDKFRNFNSGKQKFWECKPNLVFEHFSEDKAKEYAEKYYNLLSDSVRIRLRADVKIGAALSGGLDSSTISYIINKQLKNEGKAEKQETFSSVYKSKGTQYCDESKYIDELAEFLNVNSNQIEPRLEDIINEHRNMIYAMENPAVGPNMGGWYTFKCVQQSSVIINLDGQGADEQLAGYFQYLWRYFTNLPLPQIYKEFKVCSKIPGVIKRKLLISIAVNVLMKLFSKRFLVNVMEKFGIRKAESWLAPVNQALYDDTTNGMLTNLLHFGDSQSMAHSVESRVPFMDYRLVEYLASVPLTYKIHKGWTKYIARVAMDGKLPDKIAWRKDKMGWPDPADHWFRGELKEWFCREIESSIFLKRLGVGQRIRKRIASNEPITRLVWLLNLAVWYKRFFA